MHGVSGNGDKRNIRMNLYSYLCKQLYSIHLFRLSTLTASTLYSHILNITTAFYFPWTELFGQTQLFDMYLLSLRYFDSDFLKGTYLSQHTPKKKTVHALVGLDVDTLVGIGVGTGVGYS